MKTLLQIGTRKGGFIAVKIGTQGGDVLASRDGGDHWDSIFSWSPPIYALETAIV